MQSTLDAYTPQAFLAVPVEEFTDWLASQRVDRTKALTSPDDAALRRQFGELSQRWSPLLTAEKLHDGEVSTLHDIAVRVLDLSKWIYSELENLQQKKPRIVPEAILSRMMDWSALLLDQISSQLELIESTARYAEELHDSVAQLVSGKSISPVWLTSLSRRMALEMKPQPPLWQWIPWPGHNLAACVPAQKWQSEPEVYTQGIQTARLIAWMGSRWLRLGQRLELFLLAAFLQDVGFLRMEGRTQRTPSELKSKHQAVYRKHCSLGAALASGVSDYSIELSFLIAQHHECIDGTGYPHGLDRFKQTRDVQLFANVVRFQDLLTHQLQQTTTVEAACYQAGFQLFLESAQGAWSSRTTLELLDALDEELPETFDSALATGQPFLADQFLEKRWERHPAQSNVPVPHFLFSRTESPRELPASLSKSTVSRMLRSDRGWKG